MKTILLILSINLFTCSIFSQTDFAKIEKNKNSRANSLFHELNTSKDTLMLKCESKILHVYSINSEYKREFDVYIDETELQVPLKNLSIGKHVMVVDLNPTKIIFVVHVYGSNPLVSIGN